MALSHIAPSLLLQYCRKLKRRWPRVRSKLFYVSSEAPPATLPAAFEEFAADKARHFSQPRDVREALWQAAFSVKFCDEGRVYDRFPGARLQKLSDLN